MKRLDITLEITLQFSLSDAITLFRSKGLLVERRQKQIKIQGILHDLEVWQVQDPTTSEWVNLEDAFRLVVIERRTELLSDVNKFELYKILAKLSHNCGSASRTLGDKAKHE